MEPWMSGDLLVTLVKEGSLQKFLSLNGFFAKAIHRIFAHILFGKTNHMSLTDFREAKCNLTLGLIENLEYW